MGAATTRRGKRGGKADRDELRRVMLNQGRSLADVAVEMTRRYGITPRAAWRHTHGLTQDEVAALYNESDETGQAGMSGSRICEFENWPAPSGKKPSVHSLIRLATVFQTTPSRLLSVSEYTQLSARDRIILEQCETRAALDEESQSAIPTSAPASITALIPPAATESNPPPLVVVPQPQPQPAASMTAGTNPTADLQQTLLAVAYQSAEFGSRAETQVMGDITLEQLYADIARMARAYLHSPMLPLFTDMVYLRDRLFDLINARTHRPYQTRQLYLFAGATCGMLAYVSDDLGHRDAAMTQARTALICADQADHRGLRAWVLGLQSMITYWAGRPEESARFARDGQDLAATGTTPARLASLEARAWARATNQADAFAAMRRATLAREQVGSGDEIDEFGGIFSFPLAKQHSYAGTSYIWLDDPTASMREASAAIAAYQRGAPDERAYFDETVSRIDLATALLQQGHLDGIAEALRPVWTLGEDRRLDGIVGRLGQLRDALKSPVCRNSAIVRELVERIDNFQATTPVAEFS